AGGILERAQIGFGGSGWRHGLEVGERGGFGGRGGGALDVRLHFRNQILQIERLLGQFRGLLALARHILLGLALLLLPFLDEERDALLVRGKFVALLREAVALVSDV